MQRFASSTLFFFTTLLLISLVCSPLQAASKAKPKYLFKIASLAPSGSVWVNQFEKFAKEVSDKTGGEVGFRVYPGGVMGDDTAMYRKMRVGQLHGGGFTMTGIANIVPDFRILSIPFFFDSYEEVDYVKARLIPTFREQFKSKGLEFVAMTEVGFIYCMSTQPISNLEKLKNSKNWSPAGDPVSVVFLDALNITPMQLTIPDVLTSLQSGLVETVYNSLYGSIVLQWFTKARYVVDIPYGYAYGVFVLNGKKFAKLPKAYQTAIHEAADIHFPALLDKTRQSHIESRQVLEERGNEFIKLEQKTEQTLRDSSRQAVGNLIPKSLSRKIYDQAVELRKEYRTTATVTAEKSH